MWTTSCPPDKPGILTTCLLHGAACLKTASPVTFVHLLFRFLYIFALTSLLEVVLFHYSQKRANEIQYEDCLKVNVKSLLSPCCSSVTCACWRSVGKSPVVLPLRYKRDVTLMVIFDSAYYQVTVASAALWGASWCPRQGWVTLCTLLNPPAVDLWCISWQRASRLISEWLLPDMGLEKQPCDWQGNLRHF